MHEFRTPLASIEGAGSVLEDTTLTEEKRQEFVAIILKECQRLDLLVGLLDFAHPRSPQYRNEDVVSLIDEVVRRSVNEADEPPHPLRKDVAPGLPQLFCDRELIQQAVLNLLAHTRQVTPPGNEIVLGARSANDHVLIEVTNRPMPAGGKYPDPVYQAASLEYDDEPDLLIVRQIVKRHAGAVRVKRTPDLGVTISMILPFTPRTAT
jgi:two-component system sporulation sensor kinase B